MLGGNQNLPKVTSRNSTPILAVPSSRLRLRAFNMKPRRRVARFLIEATLLDPTCSRDHIGTIRSASQWYRSTRSFVLALALLSFPCQAFCANWPAWRGNGTGLSADTNLATKWDAHNNVLWKTRIMAKGHSSPIIWENRIFLTGAQQQPLVNTRQVILFALSITLTVLAWKIILARRKEYIQFGPALRTAHRVDLWGTIIAISLACAGWVS